MAASKQIQFTQILIMVKSKNFTVSLCCLHFASYWGNPHDVSNTGFCCDN